jgi:glucan phosphoethanolaminetransferase (alkaline phosphatase superfamily)
MKKTEKILIGIAILAIVLKYLFIPVSGALFTFSMMILSFIYFYLGFILFNNIRLRKVFKKESYKGISKLKIVGAICTGSALSLITIGFLFKGQHWPGADFNLLSGVICCSVVLIISLIKYNKSKSEYYKKILNRVTIGVILGFLMYLVPTRTFVNFRFRNYPKYLEVYEEFEKDQSNNTLRDKLHIEYNRATMDSVAFEYFMDYDFVPFKEYE